MMLKEEHSRRVSKRIYKIVHLQLYNDFNSNKCATDWIFLTKVFLNYKL